MSEPSAVAMQKLFPGFGVNYGKTKQKFNPSGECVVSELKRKKKSTNARIKPRNIAVVLLRKKSIFVPKGHSRQLLNKQGRIHKILFCRRMSENDVKIKILESFASFQLEDLEFFQCDQNNILLDLHGKKMDGDSVFEVAGQGSLYVFAASSQKVCEC